MIEKYEYMWTLNRPLLINRKIYSKFKFYFLKIIAIFVGK